MALNGYLGVHVIPLRTISTAGTAWSGSTIVCVCERESLGGKSEQIVAIYNSVCNSRLSYTIAFDPFFVHAPSEIKAMKSRQKPRNKNKKPYNSGTSLDQRGNIKRVQ